MPVAEGCSMRSWRRYSAFSRPLGSPGWVELDAGAGGDVAQRQIALTLGDLDPERGAQPVELVDDDVFDLQPVAAVGADVDVVLVDVDDARVEAAEGEVVLVGVLGLADADVATEAAGARHDAPLAEEVERDRVGAHPGADVQSGGDAPGDVERAAANVDVAGRDALDAVPVQLGGDDVLRRQRLRAGRRRLRAAPEVQVDEAVLVAQVVAGDRRHLELVEMKLLVALLDRAVGLLGVGLALPPPLDADPGELCRALGRDVRAAGRAPVDRAHVDVDRTEVVEPQSPARLLGEATVERCLADPHLAVRRVDRPLGQLDAAQVDLAVDPLAVDRLQEVDAERALDCSRAVSFRPAGSAAESSWPVIVVGPPRSRARLSTLNLSWSSCSMPSWPV